MKIAVVGGTGKEGRGMAVRWARAGHSVFIGSRDGERASATAAEVRAAVGGDVTGGDNNWATKQAEVVLISVPYSAHDSTLRGLKSDLEGRIVIDITVPLQPPHVRRVHLPKGQSAALEAQALLGPGIKLVAALHHVSSVHLLDLEHDLDCDVLVCGDDDAANQTVIGLIADLGGQAFDAGPLVNSIALEALTPVLLHINKKYKGPGVGIRVTGLKPA